MIGIRDITLKVPKLKEITPEWQAQYDHDRTTQRDAEFFIRIDRSGCVRYECHATLLNCRQCMFRFKCYTEKKYFLLDPKTDSGLLYLREKWGMLWGQHLSAVGCGGANVIEKEGFSCENCDEAVGFCQHEAEE